MRKVLVWLPLLISVILCTLVYATEEMNPFQCGYSQYTCAPWDGLALEVILQRKPPITLQAPPRRETYPAYKISLWEWPVKQDTWLDFTSNYSSKGSIRYCVKPPDGGTVSCTAKKGWVKITRSDSHVIEGQLKFEHPDTPRAEIMYPFRAPFIPKTDLPPFCG